MYTSQALAAVVEDIDNDLTGLYSGLSQTQGSDGGGLAVADIITARTTLSDAKAPKKDRFFVAGTEAYALLLAHAEFTSTEKYGSSTPVMEGELGRIYGFRVFESQRIVTATGDHNLAFQRQAFGIDFLPLPPKK